MTDAAVRLASRPPPAGGRLDAVWLLAALLVVANLVPLFAVLDPPLQDYPNHLLRAHLFLEYENPRFGYAAEYTRSFLPGPYLLADGLTVALAQLVPLRLAGKLVLALAVTLVPLAVMALLGAIRPERRLLGLAAFPAAYHWPFHMGFVSYSLSLAPAFFALALWFRRRESFRRRDAIGLACLVLLAYLGHLFTFGALAVLLLVGALFDPRHRRSLAGVLVAVVPTALFAVASASAGRGAIARGEGDWLLLVYDPLHQRLRDAATIFAGFAPDAENRFFAAVALLLAPCVLLGLPRRDSRRPLGLAVAAAALYLVLPDHLAGANFLLSFVSIRVPLFVIVLLLAAAHPPRSARLRQALAALLAAAALLRIAQLTSHYRAADRDLQAYRAALARLPAEARPAFEVNGRVRRGRISPEALYGNYFFLRGTAARIPRLEAFVGPLRMIAYRRPDADAATSAGLEPPREPSAELRCFARKPVRRARAILALRAPRAPELAQAASAAGFSQHWAHGSMRWLVHDRAAGPSLPRSPDHRHGFAADADHLVVFQRRARGARRAPPGFVEVFAQGRARLYRRLAPLERTYVAH